MGILSQHKVHNEPEEGWSQLPLDILSMIVDVLASPDCARFRSVCAGWNTAPSPLHTPTGPPWMLLSPSSICRGSSGNELERNHNKGNQKHDKHNTEFYSIYDKKTYKLSRGHLVDVMAECRVIVSCSLDGWLMYMDKVCELRCVHLVTGERLHPPSITTFPNIMGVETDCQGCITGYNIRYLDGFEFYSCDSLCYYYRTSILIFPENLFATQYSSLKHNSAMVTSGEYLIVLVHDAAGILAFARPGDSSWKVDEILRQYVSSIILHRGFLYAVDSTGRQIFRIQFNSDLSLHSINKQPSKFTFLSSSLTKGSEASYFVQFDDHLWLIWRILDVDVGPYGDDQTIYYTPKTIRFHVFRFDENKTTWVEMDTIGEYAIFVGKNYPLALSTNDFPHMSRDCIYYTDSYEECYRRPTSWDMGVFSLVEKSVTPFYDLLGVRGLPQPTWVMPFPL